MTEHRFATGDRVELTDGVPHRPQLRAGLTGEVVVGDESDPTLGFLSILFPGHARPMQLRRQHIRLVRAPDTLPAEKE